MGKVISYEFIGVLFHFLHPRVIINGAEKLYAIEGCRGVLLQKNTAEAVFFD